MATKPTEVVALKVRIREKTRRVLEVAAKKEGHSVNREIERRLERTLIDEGVQAVIDAAAGKAAAEFAKVMIEHIHNLMLDKAGEFARIDQTLDRIDRTLKLHEVILTQRKTTNG
jgi:hypothetical protein